jgi:hypothetical protein
MEDEFKKKITNLSKTKREVLKIRRDIELWEKYV